jgi:Fe2+ transport system protein FeoA
MDKRLSECAQGDKVRIVRVNGSGAFKNRLMEMGFRKDTELEIVKYAPLKDPVEIKICGYNVTLRVDEAALLDVVVLHGGTVLK